VKGLAISSTPKRFFCKLASVDIGHDDVGEQQCYLGMRIQQPQCRKSAICLHDPVTQFTDFVAWFDRHKLECDLNLVIRPISESSPATGMFAPRVPSLVGSAGRVFPSNNGGGVSAVRIGYLANVRWR